MNVTIICDASYCQQTKAGGWGSIIASDRGKAKRGGKFKGLSDNPMEAEMKAVVNGLNTAIFMGLVEDGDYVLLQTDCVPAIQHFERAREVVVMEGFIVRQAAVRLNELVLKHNLTVEFRHVRGHTSKTDRRSLANQWCDVEAKKHMRNHRRDLNDKQK